MSLASDLVSAVAVTLRQEATKYAPETPEADTLLDAADALADAADLLEALNA